MQPPPPSGAAERCAPSTGIFLRVDDFDQGVEAILDVVVIAIAHQRSLIVPPNFFFSICSTKSSPSTSGHYSTSSRCAS